MKLAITALGWGFLGTLFLAAACEKPEAFHLVATAPKPGMDVNPAGGAGGSDPSGSGGQLMTMSSHFGTGGVAEATGGTTGVGGAGGGGFTPEGVIGTIGGGGGSSTPGGATGLGGDGAAGGALGSAGGNSLAAGGGAGGVCAACALSIQCRNDSPSDSTAMHAEIWLSNASAQPVALGQLRLRYYYVNEGSTISLEVFDKSFKNPDGSGYRGTAATFTGTDGKLTTPPMDYTDIAINSTELLDSTVSFYFKMSLHDASHTKLDLTNDYSAAPTAIVACPKIVVFLGDAVVAGVPP
ncbi:MAG TPA: hypothetical protein VGP07_26545 [Polyangia bacterium]|jgi:hypothetical protein